MSKRQGSLFSYSFVERNLQTASKRARLSSPETSTQSSQASFTPEEETDCYQGSDQPPSTDLGKYSESEIVHFTNEQKYWILNHAF